MSALTLKLIALVSMLLDHIGYCVPSLRVLRYIGRLAFPIYVFLLVNGYSHTSSRLRYALRLGVFALLSQLPFTLHSRFNSLPWQGMVTIRQAMALPFHGSVFVTLFFAFVCLWSFDAMRRRKVLRWLAPLPTLAVCVLFYFKILDADYGAKGILLAMTFYLFGKKPALLYLGSFISLFHPNLITWAGELPAWIGGSLPELTPMTDWNKVQLFALCALPLIESYNGKRGWQPKGRGAAKAMQLGFYLFYPVHLLILYFIFC